MSIVHCPLSIEYYRCSLLLLTIRSCTCCNKFVKPRDMSRLDLRCMHRNTSWSADIVVRREEIVVGRGQDWDGQGQGRNDHGQYLSHALCVYTFASKWLTNLQNCKRANNFAKKMRREQICIPQNICCIVPTCLPPPPLTIIIILCGLFHSLNFSSQRRQDERRYVMRWEEVPDVLSCGVYGITFQMRILME